MAEREALREVLLARFTDTAEGAVLVIEDHYIRPATTLELEFRAALAEAAPPSEEERRQEFRDGWDAGALFVQAQQRREAEAAPPSGGITLDTMFADVPPSRALLVALRKPGETPYEDGWNDALNRVNSETVGATPPSRALDVENVLADIDYRLAHLHAGGGYSRPQRRNAEAWCAAHLMGVREKVAALSPTAEPPPSRALDVLLADLEACPPKMGYVTGSGPVHEGWVVSDHLMLRVRAALSPTAEPDGE